MNNRTYTVIDSVSLTGVTFSEVMETSINTVRKNNDGTQTVLKFEGNEPPSLTGITKVNIYGRDYHTHSEILEVMSLTGTTGWTSSEEI